MGAYAPIREGMSAAIGIYEGNVIKVITVDNNGNPAFLGALLYGKYQTQERVEKIFKLGDLVELCERLKPESSIGHYVLKDGSKVKEVRLQEGVTISKHRDIRQVDGDLIKKNKPIKPRIYPNPFTIYASEGVEFVYIYKPNCEEWETWGQHYKTHKFEKLVIDYMFYIKNLENREDITDLTLKEKEKLSYLKKGK
ncbi:hypothetical protein [Sinanaerobacter sp. ZZT-01]|uniref:hypothetical protein n=1 Tax=Sinanaerobacter sp. ZZT-01 TaxID=3111540 RepID=UPI002D76A9F7|nr:hypothetical protein [Sinanaerobacter sp. ZZT-01]WRR92682.1 hypothetical protein U5921_11595 [Sinanaerobacter sp. ZZT-01]